MITFRNLQNIRILHLREYQYSEHFSDLLVLFVIIIDNNAIIIFFILLNNDIYFDENIKPLTRIGR